MSTVKTKIKTPAHTYYVELKSDYLTISLLVEQDRRIWVEYTLTTSHPSMTKIQMSYISSLMAQLFYPQMAETTFLNQLERLSQRTMQNWITQEGRNES